MTETPRPLLGLTEPAKGARHKQPSRSLPRLGRPGIGRQGERLEPQFRELAEAFEAQRAALAIDGSDEIDPELVLVFDLMGSVKDFQNAVARIQGLEFLAQLADDALEPDDDFHMIDTTGERSDAKLQHSLYIVMSNAKAAGQLVSLFDQWLKNPNMKFAHGLGKFGSAFAQLRAIRRWSVADRIRDTGLLEEWQVHLDVAGQSRSAVRVEVEMWFRTSSALRTSAEQHVRALVERAGGTIRDRAELAQIRYHALLAELPIQQVEAVLSGGAETIELLDADEIMLVSPARPMTFSPPTAELAAPVGLVHDAPPSDQLPQVALLDGLPLVNHLSLAGRLVVDDPEDLGSNYPVRARHHGTAMASLILHGDLSQAGPPSERPLYVRPLLRPHEHLVGCEQVDPDKLAVDLVHKAVRRIVEGEGGKAPSAPSVRIVNLSIGIPSRALVRKISPLGRLLDWLAVEYNLLFVVSAGNHDVPLAVDAASCGDLDQLRSAALREARDTSRLRGLLPPGDSINALTVGATHEDASDPTDLPDTVVDITLAGLPALYGATGPGVGRSIKPDLHHAGGRAVYRRPSPTSGSGRVTLEVVPATSEGPGTRVAAPGLRGALDATAFTHGTSNATALVSREASRIMDLLEKGPASVEDPPFPDAQYFPVLTKALLVHAASWGDRGRALRDALHLESRDAKRHLTALLGYGALDAARTGRGAANRAVLVGAGSIARDELHTYAIPLPPSMRARAEWHRITVTLAFLTPAAGQLTRYRGAKVFFDLPDKGVTGADRAEAHGLAVTRGTCQHEVLEGTAAMVFGEGESLPIHVQCMDDAARLRAGQTVRYGLVVSVETAIETSATVFNEVRTHLRAQVAAQARDRVQG